MDPKIIIFLPFWCFRHGFDFSHSWEAIYSGQLSKI